LARALAQKPRLLLLDEPLAHVDLVAQRDMATQLAAYLREEAITTLWVTHRPGEVSFVEARLSIMAEGRVVEEVAPERVSSWLAGVGA
jgi:ABC-type sulfate/molybdate transport systems ATPase subunit